MLDFDLPFPHFDVFDGSGEMAEVDAGAAGGGRPTDAVGNDVQNAGVVVGGVGFVAGAKVEDFAAPAIETAPAPKDFAALKPTDENEFVRLGDVKVFAVHFFMGDFDVVAQALGDGMAGVDDPDALFFADFAPFEVAGGAHEFDEDFGEMGGVQGNQSQPFFDDAFVNAVDDFVRNLAVRHVAPPNQDIGGGKDFFGQAVFGLVEGGGFNVKTLLAQGFGNGFVHPFRVNCTDVGVVPFVVKFVPDGHAGKNGHVEPL